MGTTGNTGELFTDRTGQDLHLRYNCTDGELEAMSLIRTLFFPGIFYLTCGFFCLDVCDAALSGCVVIGLGTECG